MKICSEILDLQQSKTNASVFYSTHNFSDSKIMSPQVKFSNNHLFEYLFPFFAEIFKITSIKQVALLTEATIKLDLIARKIDSIIDNNPNSYSVGASINSFPNLKNEVDEMFFSIFNEALDQNLLEQTYLAIELSFQYNTILRPQVYSFTKIPSSICTTYYLLPLIQNLTKLSKIKYPVNKLFYLINNYIQILDDFIDIQEDLINNVNTPITIELKRISQINNFNEIKVYQLKTLKSEMNTLLETYFNFIIAEIKEINPKINIEIFMSEWYDFQYYFLNKSCPESIQNDNLSKFLKEIKQNIPKIICYTP